MIRSRSGRFWDKEYHTPTHLALSTEPSEDLLKFLRWRKRQENRSPLTIRSQILDLGCGNGRHLIYLAREFGCRGLGLDTSAEAIKQAQAAAGNLPLTFARQTIATALPLADASTDLVLDMMSSHYLTRVEREALRGEVYRVLKPGGWLLFKAFLLDEDRHAKRLLRDSPAGEAGSYIHPKIGLAEHVWNIEEIEAFFAAGFITHKIEKSHKHLRHGRAHKRRYVVVYLEKAG